MSSTLVWRCTTRQRLALQNLTKGMVREVIEMSVEGAEEEGQRRRGRGGGAGGVTKMIHFWRIS